MSIFNFITRTFDVAHGVIHAGMEASYQAEMASISAQYDQPGPWTSSGPPVDAKTAMDDAYYTAMARDIVARGER